MRTLPYWAATPIGLLTGLIVGTIGGSFYLTLALGMDWLNFDILAVWKLGPQTFNVNPDAAKVAFGSVAFATVGCSILAFVWTFQRQRDDYGSAHWQTKPELKKNDMLRPLGAGFVCGKLGKPGSNAAFVSSAKVPHVMMVAPTRAGKGVGFVIPNLLSFQGSMIVLDVKGENFDSTSRYRAKKGDEVYRFSPFDWANSTHRYNPLARIAKCETFAQQFTEVSILADLFLDKDNRQADTFSEAGKTIFVGACLLAIQRGRATFGEVNRIVSDGANKNKQYAAYAEEAEEETLKSIWINAASTSDRLLTSNIQALKTAGLKQWDNPAVVEATKESDFDFATFRKQPQSLYIAVSEDHISTLAPLLRLMFADLIASIRLNEPGEDEPWPVMIMIDEFQQMGAMPYLERAIHTLASYGGRVAIIAQSLAALDKIYGPEGRESLENGAGLKLFITPRDGRTVKEVSLAVGSTTREAVTRSYGRSKGFMGAESTTARLEERPLLSETQARTMDPDKVVILAPPQHAIMADRIKYFEDPTFKAMIDAQEGLAHPYPPLRATKAATPEVGDNPAEDKPEKEAKKKRKQTRRLKIDLSASVTAKESDPASLDRDAPIPESWEQALSDASQLDLGLD